MIQRRKSPVIEWAGLPGILISAGMGFAFLFTTLKDDKTFHEILDFFQFGIGIFLIVIALLVAVSFVLTIKYRRILIRDAVKAQAKIIDRQEYHTPSYENESHTYKLTFEFNPIEAKTSSGMLTLNASVSKVVYEKLKGAKTATIIYSREDPRIVYIAGESWLWGRL